MVWDVATGARRHLIKPQSEGDSLKIWDVMSATPERLVLEQPGPASTGYMLAPDNLHSMVITMGGQGIETQGIYIYNLENKKVRRIYDGREDDHRSNGLGGMHLQISPGGERNQIAYCVWSSDPQHPGSSFRILIDDLKKAAPVVEISDELGWDYTGCAFSHDGRVFCTVCQHWDARGGRLPVGRVALWDPRTGEKVARVNTRGRSVSYPCFSPTGRDLAILGGNAQNIIYICSTRETEVQRTLTDYAKKPGRGQLPLGDILYTADGSYLVAWGDDGTIMFWETKDYREVLWVKLYPKDIQWLEFSADGRMLATGGEKDEWDAVKFWDLDQFLSLMRGNKAGPGAAPLR